MVLKNRIQKRIGILFFIFSFMVLLLNTIRGYHFHGSSGLFNLRNLSYLLYVLVFGLSIKFKLSGLKILQVLAISTEGVLTLVDSPNDCFFGLTFIFIAMLLGYVYGYFDKYGILKGLLFSSILLPIFSQFSLKAGPTPWLSSIMWIGFLWVSIFIFWILIKDHVKEYQEKSKIKEQQLQKSLNELKQKIQEYSEISHISLSTNKELLEIIRNHEIGGCDD